MDTWNSEMDTAMFAARVATVALGVLGMLGAMLAVTGVFGMASYAVSKRLRELGIRVALGASQRQILRTSLGRALVLMTAGSAAGLVLGVLATRVLSYIVYEATPKDPMVLGGVGPDHASARINCDMDSSAPCAGCRSADIVARRVVDSHSNSIFKTTNAM